MSGRIKSGVVVLTLLAAPLGAEEVGQLTARLDGVPQTWRIYALDRAGERMVTAGFRQSQWLAELQVQGLDAPKFSGADGLSVTVRFTGWYEDGQEPLSVDILYTPNGLSGPLWTSRGTATPARAEILRFEVFGSFGEIEMAFSGEVCRKTSLSQPADLGTCMEVLGVVETQVAME